VNDIQETEINIISVHTEIKGKVVFDQTTRFYGDLEGDVEATQGSVLVLGETGRVQGNIIADTLLVDGYVKGDIEAETKVFISRTGRVQGNIKTPCLKMEFGSFFEGNSVMKETQKSSS